MNEAPTRARILSESAWFTGGVALLSASFWVLDFVTDKPSWLPKQLPLGAFMACVPAVVAVLMARRSRFDVARPRVLRAPEPAPRALILQAIALIGTAALVAAATVTDRKDYPADVGILPAVALAAALVAAAWLEEVGWQGFLFPRLARLWGHYASAFGVGTIWAAWHVPLFLQAGRPAAWVLWWSLATIALRFVIAQFWRRSGASMAVATAAHAASNAFILVVLPALGLNFSAGAMACAYALLAFAVCAGGCRLEGL